MEYYSTVKRKEIWTNVTTWMNYYAKCNKPVTKRQILFDSSYKRYLD